MWITEVTIAEKVSDLLFIKNLRFFKSFNKKAINYEQLKRCTNVKSFNGNASVWYKVGNLNAIHIDNTINKKIANRSVLYLLLF